VRVGRRNLYWVPYNEEMNRADQLAATIPAPAQLLSTNRAQPLVDRIAGRLGQPVQRNRGRKQQVDLVLLTDQQ
jgi:hypothetical protein